MCAFYCIVVVMFVAFLVLFVLACCLWFVVLCLLDLCRFLDAFYVWTMFGRGSAFVGVCSSFLFVDYTTLVVFVCRLGCFVLLNCCCLVLC